MKPVLTLALTLFFQFLTIVAAFGQYGLNQQDDQGRRFGRWEGRYPNGNLRYKGQFSNNRPVGLFEYFLEDGTLRATNTFEPGGVKAHHKSYSKSGILIAEGIYLNQKKDSIWLIFSDADGAMLSEESYQYNQLHGLTRVFYPKTSKLAEETQYESGMKQGLSKHYFESGAPMSETFFVEDQPHGRFVVYYENGKVQVEGSYDHGLKTGLWKTYDEQGTLTSEESYKERE